MCLLLVVITLTVYNPIVHNSFINFDDGPYITENPHVRAGLTWNTVKWAFTSYKYAGFWFPLTWLSHALDCQLFHLNPIGHHYVSLLFHALNAVLLFLFLRNATKLVWPSLVVAAVFAIHPVNVESVAWAAERKNVLSMLFFLLALHAYRWYVLSRKLRCYLVVVLLFALGLMTKAQIITLPFVLLLLDYWPLQRVHFKSSTSNFAAPRETYSFWWLVAEKAPLFVLSGVSAVATISAQHAADAVRTLSDYSLSIRLENAISSYVRYIRMVFLPWHLVPMYPHPKSFSAWELVVSAVVLLFLTAGVLYSRRHYLIVGWLWFLGTMIPMIGVVQAGEQGMADRFAYLPYIGLFLMTVWFLNEIAGKYDHGAILLSGPAILFLLFMGALSYRQLKYWQDSETLWRYTLQVTKQNYVAHDNLGRALVDQGRSEEAIAQFQAAEALFEYRPTDYLRFGIYEQRNGHVSDSIKEFERVLHMATDPALRVTAFSNLGFAHMQLKNYDQAKQNYEDALRLDQNCPPALLGTGLLAKRRGDLPLAVDQFSRLTKLQPNAVDFLLLSALLRQSGRVLDAQVAYEQAQQIAPDLTMSQQTADRLLSQ